MNRLFIILFLSIVITSCKDEKKSSPEVVENIERSATDSLIFPDEKHFKSLKQITFGGDNAEAYWSFDDKQLVFQSNNPNWNVNCDQMFLMNADDTFEDKIPPMISTGKGRTTCAYFLPDNKHIVYASTHLGDEACPDAPLKKDGKYIWPIYDSYDIFVADLEGNITAQLTNEPGYDAEATVSPQGDKIVFTSTRNGDLDLYTMNIDGSDVKQITFELGYDGGAFFSPNGSKLIFRSSRPKTDEEIAEYKSLLKEGLVQPTEMELYICNADGSDLRQLTNLGNANWSPFFLPDGERVLFSSNFEAERGFPFNLYIIGIDGKGLERVTHSDTFDAFPVFSNDGKKLMFSSNRHNGGGHDTNLFVAEWQD
ncbi:TolB family protein [Gelidibacter pelagius]|uniref:PD40 domain-containing protein n=1 Tax=Gelidibacter pelagius TaxID=2819985 RepID=A0ABS3SMX1_9FLAO|nr:PD40 domain-containing protein [Gelidibacter pelagius]MBO3096796.1 PD40 domain-containing protein [Gelidibacter pelagius]